MNRRAIPILAAVIFLWLVNTIFTAARVRLFDTATPSLKFSYNITKKLTALKFPESRTVRENRLLKDELEAMKAELVRMNEFSAENQRLRGLLDFKKKTAFKTIAAQAIGRDPSNWTSIIYINKGKEKGIKKFMAAATDKGLVGKVVEAGAKSSKVMFITDPDSRVGVIIQRTRHDGLLYGTLSRQCQMLYIHLEADVWPGDIVLTSGQGGTIPEGLLVGTVEDVFVDKSGLYQTAIVKPAQDLSKVEEVLCIE